jgi:hypothetical protein
LLSSRGLTCAMNLTPRASEQSIDICGFSVAPRSCVIHFYYSQTERQRFSGFLLDGVAAGDTVALACTRDGYEGFAEALELVGIRPADPGLLRLEISPDVRASVARVAAVLRDDVRRRQKRARLLCDFERMVGQEGIFELESLLSSSLAGLDLVCVTQYDGRAFGAPITIEQFRTHALAIVGNALWQENKNYTSPETYYKQRAASSK